MNQNFVNSSSIQICIKMIPSNSSFSCIFDSNRSFGDLKDNLQEGGVIPKDAYYFEMNGEVFSDNMILREKNVFNNSCLNAVRKDIINIIVKVEDKDLKQMTVTDSVTIKALKEDVNKSYNLDLDGYVAKVDGNACDPNSSLKDCGVVYGSTVEFIPDPNIICIHVKDNSFTTKMKLKKTTKLKTLIEALGKGRDDGKTKVILQKNGMVLDATERTFEDYGIISGDVLNARFEFPGGISYLN